MWDSLGVVAKLVVVVVAVVDVGVRDECELVQAEMYDSFRDLVVFYV